MEEDKEGYSKAEELKKYSHCNSIIEIIVNNFQAWKRGIRS